MEESDHYLALPTRGSGSGVLVLHSWWGLNGFFRDLCDRLADEGFVALAPDLFGGRTANSVAAARRLRASATRTRREPAYKMLTRKIDLLRHSESVTGESIGVLGCSMGGHWAFWLSQRPELPIAATVTFYAARGGDYSGSRADFLCHFAERDDFVSAPSVRKVMRDLAAARRTSTAHEYPGTTHWFFESDRADAYDPEAAELAWTRTVAFLRATLSGGRPGATRHR